MGDAPPAPTFRIKPKRLRIQPDDYMPPERVPKVRNQGGTLTMITLAILEMQEAGHRKMVRRLGGPRPSEAALRQLMIHPQMIRSIFLESALASRRAEQ